MKSFLLVYYRSEGRLESLTPYDSLAEAMEARFVLEREGGSPDREVVVLMAKSVAALRRTHGRYFYTAHKLLSEMVS